MATKDVKDGLVEGSSHPTVWLGKTNKPVSYMCLSRLEEDQQDDLPAEDIEGTEGPIVTIANAIGRICYRCADIEAKDQEDDPAQGDGWSLKRAITMGLMCLTTRDAACLAELLAALSGKIDVREATAEAARRLNALAENAWELTRVNLVPRMSQECQAWTVAEITLLALEAWLRARDLSPIFASTHPIAPAIIEILGAGNGFPFASIDELDRELAGHRARVKGALAPATEGSIVRHARHQVMSLRAIAEVTDAARPSIATQRREPSVQTPVDALADIANECKRRKGRYGLAPIRVFLRAVQVYGFGPKYAERWCVEAAIKYLTTTSADDGARDLARAALRVLGHTIEDVTNASRQRKKRQKAKANGAESKDK